jgi:SAM-dependent methyltransferase
VTHADARPGFNHNDFYHRYLLRHVPAGCGRALDVGCGTGVFARRLAHHARSVEAMDRAPQMTAKARALSTDVQNVHYLDADLAGYDLDTRRYDYITCIASLHHMPYTDTIIKLHEALAPGGVLAIVGLYRQATPADYAYDLVAIPANMTANAAIRMKARYTRRPTGQHNTAPVMDPQMTLGDIKRETSPILPGAVIRRRLYWRYTLLYQRPPSSAG